jgi:TPR repeat protein
MTESTETRLRLCSLLDQARVSVRSGQLGAARSKLLVAISLGSVEALIDLADVECREENREAAEVLLAQAEVVASRVGDPADYFALSGAYQLMLGAGTLAEQKKKAAKHLERAAELGLATAQATIAHWYRLGLNGLQADEASFKRWIESAVNARDPLAICEYVGYLLDKGQPMPAGLAEEVRGLSADYEEAKSLIRRLPL